MPSPKRGQRKAKRATKRESAPEEVPEAPTLQNLPPEILEMLLWNESLEFADLYYLRFACSSLRVAAASVLLKRVRWLAVIEKDFIRIMDEFRKARDVLGERLGPAAVTEWERAKLKPLQSFSVGRLLSRSNLPLDSSIGSRIFVSMGSLYAGDFLHGWGVRSEEVRLMLQIASQPPMDSVFGLQEIADVDNPYPADGTDPRWYDPFTIIIKLSGLSPKEMLEAVPSPVYLGFGWYFRVVWELECFHERKSWTKDLALEQLPRVLRTVRTFSPRMPDAKDRDASDFVLDAFCNCSSEAIAAVLIALEVPWRRMWSLVSRERLAMLEDAPDAMDVVQALFGPSGHAKSSSDCSEFFLGIESPEDRESFASDLLADTDWPVSMPFQIWDFLPPSDPPEFDARSGIHFWEKIFCDTATANSARLETYLSKLKDAAPEAWTRRMNYAIFRHFDLIKPIGKADRAQKPPETQTSRIRIIARALGNPLDSVALVMLKKLSSLATKVPNVELYHCLLQVSRELLGRNLKPPVEHDRTLLSREAVAGRNFAGWRCGRFSAAVASYCRHHERNM